MSASNQDFLFAQEAQRLGYVTEAQVEGAFELQRIMAEQLKIDERLDVILVKRGWLADEQARRVQARLEPDGRKAQIEGYRLLEKIGRGAMGTVYKALHLGLQREVAIKVLHTELADDDTQVERLRSEAKLLASLDHPNIVRALDAGESGGFPYIVMEHVEGVTLRERLQRQGPFPEAEALKIVRALADALERARRMGVVHRDVKPGNVLLTRQGEPKLMDLGLAKGPIDMELTQHGATVGTPQYISPEQAQDPRKADTRSDIYSLGATLYALVTGKPPFDGTTLAEILSKVLYENPTPPRVLAPALSSATAYLIERMMLKDPSLRYHTPAEVVADIERIQSGQSIMPAGFRGNWEAFLLRRRIRRRTTAGALVVAALALSGLGLKAWLERAGAARDLNDARAVVAAVAPEVGYGPDDDLLSILAKRERLNEALARVERFDIAEVEALKSQRQRLERVSEQLKAYEELVGGGEPTARRDTLSELIARGAWALALERVDTFRERAGALGSDHPLNGLLFRQRASLRERSQQAYLALAEQVRTSGQRPASLADFVRIHAEFAQRARSGFVLELEAQRGVPMAAELRARAEQIAQAMQAFESRYAIDAMQARLEQFALGDLRADLEEARRQVVDVVQSAWTPECQEWTPRETLLGPGGLVQARLTATVQRVQEQVGAWARDVGQTAKARAAAGDVAEAVAMLARLDNACFDADFREESFDARKLRDLILREHAEVEVRAQAAYDAVLERWLEALSAFDAGSAQRMREATTVGAAVRQQLGSRAAQVDLLGATAADFERLLGLAMDALVVLSERRQTLVPRRRSQSQPERAWTLGPVDREAWAFDARGPRDREPVRRSLFDLDPAQVVELAQSAPQAASQRSALALGALALLPGPAPLLDDGDSDLTPALAAYEATHAAFQQAGASAGPAAQHVRAVLERLQEALAAAETKAFNLHDNARTWWASRPPKLSSIYYNLKLLRTNPRLLATRYVSGDKAGGKPAVREDLERLSAEVEKLIGQEEAARRLPGVQATQLENGRLELLYDFDTDDQILAQNFPRGRGVLEPFVGPTVTPGPGVNQRLHLLRGYDEPVRETPLTWNSIFDPAEPITVEFALYPLEATVFVAVDLDGVQVAMLGLDPNWYPSMRLDDDPALLLGDERRLPLDWYGKGRGVAFHEGVDFGDPAQWVDGKGGGPGSAWPRDGHGNRWADWAGRPDQPGRLFAIPPEAQSPGRPYLRVRVVRERSKLSLYVADPKRGPDFVLIQTESRADWGTRGQGSERARMSRGTGAIQVLTWTPLAIDDLKLTGTPKERWLKR